ncbi:hypothetical protein PFISCL1PPCAC_18161, partial [Pristionchus fissidentatus]
TTVPAMALLLFMTLALVPSILFVCNTQKRREKAAIAQRQREQEEEENKKTEEERKKDKEEREEREMIRKMANARLSEELAAEAKERDETRSKRIEELMEVKGIDKASATSMIKHEDANAAVLYTQISLRRSKTRTRVKAELEEQRARKKTSLGDFEKFEKDLRSGEDRKEATPMNGTKSDEKNSNAE